jgi:hypothetical protein
MNEKSPNTITKITKNTWKKLLVFWEYLTQNSARIHGIISSPAGNQEIANHFNKIIHNK